jgi:hypothetical protein
MHKYTTVVLIFREDGKIFFPKRSAASLAGILAPDFGMIPLLKLLRKDSLSV